MTKKKTQKISARSVDDVPDIDDPTSPELVEDGAILLLERCLDTLRTLKNARRIETIGRWEMMRRLSGAPDPKPVSNLELDLVDYLGDS